jgi:nitrogen fixation NifU-like protein
MLYNNLLIAHFENPKNVGYINNPTKKVTIGSSKEGAVITLSILIENGILKDIKFKAYGGCAVIASMSYLTELVKGMRVIDILMIKPEEINYDLKLESINLIYSIMAIECLHIALS